MKAVAAYLARYRAQTRIHTASDLRALTWAIWCAALLAAVDLVEDVLADEVMAAAGIPDITQDSGQTLAQFSEFIEHVDPEDFRN